MQDFSHYSCFYYLLVYWSKINAKLTLSGCCERLANFRASDTRQGHPAAPPQQRWPRLSCWGQHYLKTEEPATGSVAHAQGALVCQVSPAASQGLVIQGVWAPEKECRTRPGPPHTHTHPGHTHHQKSHMLPLLELQVLGPTCHPSTQHWLHCPTS